MNVVVVADQALAVEAVREGKPHSNGIAVASGLHRDRRSIIGRAVHAVAAAAAALAMAAAAHGDGALAVA